MKRRNEDLTLTKKEIFFFILAAFLVLVAH